MRTCLGTITRETTGETDVLDITKDLARIIADSGIRDGIAAVFIPGSTAGVTTIEFEPGAVQDLKKAIERLAPIEGPYAHDARWGDGNGYAHVRAALLGPSVSIPIVGGEPQLGTWQQVVLCDFDNRPRTRKALVQVLGV
jgi:secondary thiamine-phosphate synthase enzyme